MTELAIYPAGAVVLLVNLAVMWLLVKKTHNIGIAYSSSISGYFSFVLGMFFMTNQNYPIISEMDRSLIWAIAIGGMLALAFIYTAAIQPNLRKKAKPIRVLGTILGFAISAALMVINPLGG